MSSKKKFNRQWIPFFKLHSERGKTSCWNLVLRCEWLGVLQIMVLPDSHWLFVSFLYWKFPSHGESNWLAISWVSPSMAGVRMLHHDTSKFHWFVSHFEMNDFFREFPRDPCNKWESDPVVFGGLKLSNIFVVRLKFQTAKFGTTNQLRKQEASCVGCVCSTPSYQWNWRFPLVSGHGWIVERFPGGVRNQW